MRVPTKVLARYTERPTPAFAGTDINERLARQRQQLNARLGLDAASKLGMDLTAALYTNEDLCPAKPTTPIKIEIRMPVQELVPSSSKPLSSREINLAKRRARQAAFCKQKSRECEEPTPPPTPPAEPDRKKIKLEVDEFSCDGDVAGGPGLLGRVGRELVLAAGGLVRRAAGGAVRRGVEARHGAASALRELLRAPHRRLRRITAGDTHQQAALFGAAWEARHGAASALRELLRAPIAASAGITAGDTHQQGWGGALQAALFGAAWEARHGAASALRELLRAPIAASAGDNSRGHAPTGSATPAALFGAAWEARHGAASALRELLRAPIAASAGITAGDTHQQGWGGALQAALFGAAWEARHGAASALRELLRAPIAASAGITAGDTHQQVSDPGHRLTRAGGGALQAALFGAAWEARHGAASALRELLRAPIAASAGITAGDTHQQGWGGALQAALFGAAWEARHGAASALRELLRAPIAASAGITAGDTHQQGWGGALQAALFGAAWEARHGAASALRELLRAPIAASAGITAGDTHQQFCLAPQHRAPSHHYLTTRLAGQIYARILRAGVFNLLVLTAHFLFVKVSRHTSKQNSQMENAHQEWLEDMALRLLCVLALDRFGDFVSDQVVAPVRETCAQTLGVTLAQMRAERVRGVAALLATLAQQRQWEARHGALLGFKYLLAARQDVACESGAIEHLIEGLSDGAEDVSAVAAGALAPAAGALAAARVSVLPAVVARLWQLLHDQDDLAAPANSYMALLASLMALPQAAKLLYPIDLADVLPRLWPYLDHSTSSVRKASLQTLRTLTRPLITVSLKSGNNGCSNQTTDGTNGDKDNAELKEVTNGVQYLMWTPELLQEAMRHIYQRILFEHVGDIQLIAVQVWENLLRYAPLGVVLVAACPLLATWLCLAMQPARLPIAPNLLLHPPPKERRTRTNSQSESVPPELRPNQKWFLGGSESLPACVRDKNVTRARCLAAEVLGYLSCYLVQPAPGIEYKAEDESPIDCFVKVVLVYLKSSSALQRLVASLVVSAWARRSQHHNLFPPNVLNTSETDNESGEDALSRLAPPALTITLHAALNQVLYYDEVALSCNKILQEARDLLAMMKHYKLPVDGEEFNNMLRLEQVIHMTAVTEAMVASMKSKRVAMTLEERRKNLQTAVNQCSNEQTILNISVQAALAGACASLNSLPEKLNPVVRPLMESIKKEIWEELQAHSAESLALLAARLVSREPSPNNKILQNLKTFLRCDPEYTPHVSLAENTEDSHGDSGSGDSGGEGKPELPAQGPIMDKYNGILTLWEQQRAAERVSPRRGRPPAAPAALAAVDDLLKNQEDEQQRVSPRRGRPPRRCRLLDVPLFSSIINRKKLRVQRRGATLAFTSLARHFGDELPQRLPKLWEFITEPFATPMTESELDNPDVEASEELISRLQVFEAVCGALGAGAWQQVARGAAAGAALTRHGHTAARHMAARALAAMARRAPHAGAARAHRRAHMAARALAAMARRAPHAVITAVIHEVRARHGHTAARHMAARALAAMARRAPHAVITAVIHEVRARHGHTAARHMAARALAAMARRAPHAVITAVIHEVRARHGHTAARHMAARALAAMARRAPHAVITAVIHELVPSLKEASSVRVRCGAAEALARVVDAMQLHVVPYIALLVVPLLGRMSDHCEAVRVMSTRCFASLIQLMPLDGGVPEPDGLAPELRERRLADKQFLDQLFDPKTIKDYKIPVPMSAELRSYQQAGVNWLRFLHEYRLHGVLCDDMGLGKTLQSIAVVAGSHAELARQGQRAPRWSALALQDMGRGKTLQSIAVVAGSHAELRARGSARPRWSALALQDMGRGKTLQSIAVVAGSHAELARQGQRAPSLVVCPPTLTGHWVFEVNKFIPSKFLKPLQYVGPPVERERLRYQVKHYNLIVASYDIVRKDIGFFSGIKWNYCILDEGHVIKNGKTKAFKAIKQLVANHRLILSGTPIQNNVLELWSLFDFLMPGLLGTERQFTARYSRPILAARDPKATPPQLQAGALAVEALHRQARHFFLKSAALAGGVIATSHGLRRAVLPFLLRRVKEDVLKELPPKITQDYYCELSPLQRRLYEQFSRSHMPQPARQQVHVFQSLHYLQNVCNHPKLVLTAEHPETARVQQHLAQQRSSLDDIEHSAKLPALKQLLLDCGIGVTADASEGAGAVVSQHRALVFCQLKKMLDIVERDLLQKHLPTVSYLRLDGAVPPHQRHALVSRFNNDVSIDLLLLTTAVGGLGLNLTGADTVIFVEHAWNPMKDLQAMDRAHRLGQRRVVNVYRLITRATIEEKIMGCVLADRHLQKFKLLTANTVISSENAAMETMGTDQLLDLFQLSGDKQGASQPQPGPSAGPAGSGAQSVLETLPDLWDDRQYEEEYDMTHFIQGLNRINT
ncbi:hypothetical protein MSG28_004314 [Choristoneura fumiferana]|uniref:Uncharacterized protein n=1 Tax=Choristoneura fumiferana TaxID=7141 RepID=A0ACC0KIE1_CHOFU|nr:hypothetical protein MSG28_004314 [Choristoneura fumiferana]